MSYRLDLESIPMLDDFESHRKASVYRVEETKADIENLRSIIHRCARENDVEELETALNKNPGLVNSPDGDMMSPLHYAARYGSLEVVKLLLKRNAIVDPTNYDKDTPLHIASKFKTWSDISMTSRSNRSTDQRDMEGNTKGIIQALVEAKPDIINQPNEYMLTPIHYAAMKSNIPALEQLIRLRASLNTEDANQMTPLLLGCVHGTQDVIRLLIKAGSDMKKRDLRQNTIFHIVALRGEPEYLRMMMKSAGDAARDALIMKNNEGKTPLRMAVEGDHPKTLQAILEMESKYHFNWANREHDMMHFAASKGYLEVLKVLVKEGGDNRQKNEQKVLPIHVAAQMNQKEVVEYLLEEKNITEDTDDYGMTPLMLAVTQDSKDCVELLVQKGADISAVDYDERSVVYLGAKFNALASVEYILETARARAEDKVKDLNASITSKKSMRNLNTFNEKDMVNQTDRDQNSPLHVVATNGYLEMMRILYKYGANIAMVNEDEETPLHRAAHSGQTGAVRQLIEWDNRMILMKDEMGNSALHLAARQGHDVTTRVLLEAGADKEARNSFQQTPLMVAVECGKLEPAQQLVLKAANVESNADSRTLLHTAAYYGYETIARFLIQSGVTIDRRDEKGRTALDVACEENRKDVARALIETDEWWSLMIPHDEIYIGKFEDKNPGGKTQRITPFRRLLAKFPELAVVIMDKCIEKNKEEEDETLCIAYNFEFIDDTYMMPDDRGEKLIGQKSAYNDDFKLNNEAQQYARNYDYIYRNHPLKLMANAEKLSLLSHPLSLALLKHKWNRCGRYFYYLALFIYIVFIVSLTLFLQNTKAPYNVLDNDTRYLDSSYFDENETCPHLPTPPLLHTICKWIVILIAVGQYLKEGVQVAQRKLGYLYNWENWIECSIYATAILTVWDFSECSSTSGVRRNWQWLLAAVGIFMGWINLLFMIRKLPRFGIYVVMFVDIVKTFFRFFPVFVLFIIAFSTAFYVVLQNRPEFSTVLISPLKTTVMMIGEFEFDGIFHGDYDTQTTKMFGSWHIVVSYMIFFFFSIIMTILLMNLLVGLAVDDIKGVQEKAELKRLAMQVDLVLQIEASILIVRRSKKYATNRYSYFPNGSSHLTGLIGCWNTFRKKFGLNAGVESENDAMYEMESEITSELRSNLQLQRNQIQNLQENVDIMYEKQVKMEAMIRMLAKGLNINIELEDKDS